MWRHVKASMGQYLREKRFYMFLKYCRNLNLNPLDKFCWLYDPSKPKTVNDSDNEVVTDTSESESEAESENEFGFL